MGRIIVVCEKSVPKHSFQLRGWNPGPSEKTHVFSLPVKKLEFLDRNSEACERGNLSESKVESRKFERCRKRIESRVSAPAISNRAGLRPLLPTHEYATACLFFSLLTPLSCVWSLLWFCATDGVHLRLQEALPDAVFCNDSLELLTVRLILRHFHVYLRVIVLAH